MSSKQRMILVLGAVVVLIGGFFVASSMFKGQRAGELEKKAAEGEGGTNNAFVRPYSQIGGSPAAKVTLTEFLDPGCEACAAVSPQVKAILDENAGQVRLVVRYAPFHQGADIAVMMLEAARKQDKYWETLQLMFDAQPQWASHHHPAPERLYELLPSLGLDMDRLRTDMQGIDIGHIVRQDMADAQELGVRKTPTFFVNGKPLSRFGLQELRDLVASEVSEAYGGTSIP